MARIPFSLEKVVKIIKCVRKFVPVPGIVF